MGFFSVDGKFYRFLSRFLDMLKLNFLWFICSIPIVTFGPATIAAFSVTMEMIDDTEGYVGKKFFKTFKANMKNGIPLGLLFLLGVYALWLDFQIMMLGEHIYIFVPAFCVGVFAVLTGFMWAFALEVRYENTLIKTIKNSYDISVRYFVRFLLLIFVIAIEVVVFIFSPVTLLFGILVGPACIMLTISGFAVPFFREIEKEDGAVIRPEKKDDDAQGEDAETKKIPQKSGGIAQRAHMNTKNK